MVTGEGLRGTQQTTGAPRIKFKFEGLGEAGLVFSGTGQALRRPTIFLSGSPASR